MKTIIYNKKLEKNKRKLLRSSLRLPEILLWHQIKGKKIKGFKFRRQYGIDRFVVDFYCPEIKLAIEVDGNSHFMDNKTECYDKSRQEFIESYGIDFLRFTNSEVLKNLGGVVDKIEEVLDTYENKQR